METNRQKKIGGIIQKDLADVLLLQLREANVKGILVSVTKVKVTTDLSQAKCYLSIFPAKEGPAILQELNLIKAQIRHELAQRTRYQLRRMPALEFYIDDSLEYIQNIERSIKGEENPINEPNLLERRKKS